uniref:S-adenosylmethionine synthase n=1 Tax=candidate division WOR-3 bacterium TaxID=2052148 RepID=A0A7C4Y675_UNCW3
MMQLITSESVTEGHPDKICDQVSDSILDAILEKDKYGRVAVETLTSRGFIMVAGEITTETYVEIPKIVRNLLKEIGYTDSDYGLDYNTCAVMTMIQEQSPDIAMGVNIGGAGDQGMMFGYATKETPELMPLPIMLAHKIVRRLAEIRKYEGYKMLRPDGKSQVTVVYEDNKPVGIETIVVSAQHDPNIKMDELREIVIENVIKKVVPQNYLRKDTKILINPTGRFVIGGPQADTGLTGRKIMVDSYGGVGKHGGGCFSGKDPTKVDRSAAYMARYVAKNIVAAGLAEKVEFQLAYAIGVEQPVAMYINTFGTSKYKDERILKVVKKIFDFTPRGIIETLNLLRPIYRRTAVYGHFGREEEGFTWELKDKVEQLKSEI